VYESVRKRKPDSLLIFLRSCMRWMIFIHKYVSITQTSVKLFIFVFSSHQYTYENLIKLRFITQFVKK